jgi:hypothetical protein
MKNPFREKFIKYLNLKCSICRQVLQYFQLFLYPPPPPIRLREHSFFSWGGVWAGGTDV